MKHTFFLYLLCLTHIANAQTSYPTVGHIEKYDDGFNSIIAPNTPIEVLGAGFEWLEGPVWVETGDYLLFSDVPKNTIFKWSNALGITEFLKPSGYTGRLPYSNESGSNGLLIDNQNRLITCEHGDRRLSAMPLAWGGKITLASHYQGKRFNSPNDVAQHPINHSFYFTDPPYGLPKQANDSLRETPFSGVYRVLSTGEVQLLTDKLTRPNGIAFSPDGTIMYIGQSDPEKAIIMEYRLNNDGNIVSERVFFDAMPFVKKGWKGLPDGLKVDKRGNIFATGPGGVWVFNASGKVLGHINTQQATANCAIGNNGKTLYITADGYLCKIALL